MNHYKIQKITMADPKHPYEPKDGERGLNVHVDPNTPEGQLIASMLFGLYDEGVSVSPEVLNKLHKAPSKYVNCWHTDTKGNTRHVRFGLGFTHSVWDQYKGTPGRQFLQNEHKLRAEIYPRYVEEAAQAWITKDPNDLEAFVNARARLLLVAEAAGVESEAVAMDDLRAAVQRLRESQGV